VLKGLQFIPRVQLYVCGCLRTSAVVCGSRARDRRILAAAESATPYLALCTSGYLFFRSSRMVWMYRFR